MFESCRTTKDIQVRLYIWSYRYICALPIYNTYVTESSTLRQACELVLVLCSARKRSLVKPWSATGCLETNRANPSVFIGSMAVNRL